MEQFIIEKIGIIHTPYKTIENMPVQPVGATEVKGTIELNPEYVPGLKDLNGFSHIILLYKFHKVSDYKLEVIPFIDNKPHGIFATRAPLRPNAIGVSIVKLDYIEGNILHINEVDMLDGTPLFDIKPFYYKYDNRENVRSGWLENIQNVDIKKLKSDSRFKDS